MSRFNVLLTAVLISVLGLIFASSSAAEYKSNPRKGKFLFRNNCRVCHTKKATAKGAGKLLQPSSKTQAEWKKTFQNGNYKKVKCIKSWEKLSDNDIKDIRRFLFDHASDSPTPLTCSDN